MSQRLPLSVIVPFLNEERWLPACIAALKRQTLDPCHYELLFVDNGSRDRSAEIVRSHTRIRLLEEPRRDPYLARNRAIQEAWGNYLVFLDADCIPAPDWLERLGEEIKVSQADIVLGYLGYPAQASIFLRCYESYYDQKLRHLVDHALTEYFFGHAGNMAVRADVFQELGLFRAMPVVGDTEIIHRLLERRPRGLIRYAQGARVIHAEVDRFRGCLSKLFECGQHSEILRQAGLYRLVPLREKSRILRRCLQERPDRPGAALAMLAALGLGYLCYSAGRLVRTRAIAWRVGSGPAGGAPAREGAH